MNQITTLEVLYILPTQVKNAELLKVKGNQLLALLDNKNLKGIPAPLKFCFNHHRMATALDARILHHSLPLTSSVLR